MLILLVFITNNITKVQNLFDGVDKIIIFKESYPKYQANKSVFVFEKHYLCT